MIDQRCGCPGHLLRAVTLLALTTATVAQEPIDPQVKLLQGRIEKFFADFPEGEQQALDALLEGSELARQPIGTGQTNRQYDELERSAKLLRSRYGNQRGYTRLAGSRVDADLVLLRYLQKFERFPVVWNFAFYRTGLSTTTGAWVVVSVRVDSKLDDLGP